MPDDEPPKNPFVRFKQHVDANISAGLQGFFGLPSLMSRNLNPQRTSPSAPASSPPDSTMYWPPMPLDSHVTHGSPFRNGDHRLLDWQEFLLWSDYSPLVLEDFPHQPRPRGIPDDIDSRDLHFTFFDAFEDLLIASSGRPLPDMRFKCEMNRAHHWYSHLLQNNRAALLVRVRSLEAAGLLDTYQVSEKPWQTSSRYGRPKIEQWAFGQEGDEHPGPSGADQDPQTQRDGVSRSMFDSKGDADEEPQPQQGHPGGRGLFAELDKVFRALGRVLEDETSSSSIFGRRRQTQAGRRERDDGETKDGPDMEDDLYSAVQSAYSTAERSLSTFLRSISDGKFTGEAESSGWHETTTHSGKPGDESQGNEVTTTKEYVDRFGNLHVKTETRRLNAEGQEIGRETRYSVRSQSLTQRDLDELSREDSSAEEGGANAAPENKMPNKKSGWFW